MNKEEIELLDKIRKIAEIFLRGLVNKQMKDSEIAVEIEEMASVIESVKTVIPTVIYEQYCDFFEVFSGFCRQCMNIEFLQANKGELISSFELFVECMEDLKSDYISRLKTCPCCGSEVIYDPLSEYYSAMAREYQAVQTVDEARPETLNRKEYSCPRCGGSDRDRLIISFLKKEGLTEACEGMKVLQIAPAAVISLWIERYCPHIVYETTDLYMENVSFQSDIMNMDMIQDETYDVIICSHVLEHVRDDRKALSEMKRILKPDGKIVFLVPIDLNASDIDEEWGLSEAENWRRFGQGDHCRSYSKAGMMHRLEEIFCVHSLGKEYFGEEMFQQCALTDTSTLYVLTKSEEVSLGMAEVLEISEELCHNGPLVSVILPCYNHEKYVAEAIESVVNQSYKNIEILVGDDGSTDGTPSIMKRYSSCFEKELYLEDNTGGFTLWKLLWQMAKGKYIAVAHSDDVWEEDKIARQVAYMEAHSECGACFTWCKYRDDEDSVMDNLIFVQPNRSSYEWMRYFWENGNALCHPSLVIRREIHNKREWHAGRQVPDFFSWIELVQMTSIHIVPKVLVYMRSHPECTSFPTKETQLRTLMEEGCGWLWVIRNMEEEFFKKTFAAYMINPDADTKAAIQCEKYFLMLNHPNVFIQYSAMCYYYDIFNDVEECMEENYHYVNNDFARDMIEKNIFVVNRLI